MSWKWNPRVSREVSVWENGMIYIAGHSVHCRAFSALQGIQWIAGHSVLERGNVGNVRHESKP